MKTCTKCKIEKEEIDFHIDKRLKSGLTSQCKECRRKSSLEYSKTDRGKESHRLNESIRREKDPRVLLFSLAKQRAKKNNIEFSLSLNDIVIPKFCPILGIKIEQGKKKAGDNSPTIDRINSKLGYIKNNIKVVSWRANRLKSDSEVHELEAILAYMYENLPHYRDKSGKRKGIRPTKFYTFNGKSQGLIDWASEYNISYSTLNNRVNRMKWDIEKALLTPVKKKGG